MSEIQTGRCYCGAVKFSVEGPFRNECICHCESCRRAAGGAYVAWASCDPDRFKVLEGELTRYVSPAGIERQFCTRCGSSLTYRHPKRAKDLDFTVVSLDDPTALRPRMHLYMCDRLPWEIVGDDLPRHETTPGAASS
jgi:hypothetical protein